MSSTGLSFKDCDMYPQRETANFTLRDKDIDTNFWCQTDVQGVKKSATGIAQAARSSNLECFLTRKRLIFPLRLLLRKTDTTF